MVRTSWLDMWLHAHVSVQMFIHSSVHLSIDMTINSPALMSMHMAIYAQDRSSCSASPSRNGSSRSSLTWAKKGVLAYPTDKGQKVLLQTACESTKRRVVGLHHILAVIT